jgi:hypothetical protein
VKDTDGDRILKQMQIYNIIQKVRRGNRLLTTKRKKRSLAFIADVFVDIEKGRYVTVKTLTLAHGISMKTIHETPYQNLKLSKMSARRVPKLLTVGMK